MSARYQIFHDTHYHYDSPVSLAQQLARQAVCAGGRALLFGL